MHPAAAKPIRFIVELPVSELPAVLTQLLSQVTAHFTTPGTPPRPPPDPDDDDDDDEPLRRSPDPPAAVKNVTPAVRSVPEGYALGRLCVRGHRWEGTRQTLRGQKSGKCRECMRAFRQRRKAPQPLAPQGTPKAPALPPPAPRPALPVLPAHLQERCFLSPIGCANAQHRYRGTTYSLRFADSEHCVMCVTPQFALAGD